MSVGNLYLIPVPLSENGLDTIPGAVKQQSAGLRYFFVENIRTARRYLKSIDRDIPIEDIQFAEINNQVAPDIQLLERWLKDGQNVGIMSEAGCPAMADPGNVLVRKAHELNAKVIPLTGPSSVLLALMASGFNGQGFRFNGYLPVKEPLRSKAIKELEQVSAARNETQIFIETPYRNNQLLQELLRTCRHTTRICIASDITGSKEMIKTLPVADWKKQAPDLHKIPSVFLLMA